MNTILVRLLVEFLANEDVKVGDEASGVSTAENLKSLEVVGRKPIAPVSTNEARTREDSL